MGRHSAPDEPDLDSAETTEIAPILVDLTLPRGRHSQADEDDTATVELATIDIAPPPPVTDKPSKADKSAEQAEAKAQRKQAKGESSTRADLRMLRQNGAVRAQALAAVIVSFLLYTIVMVVLGRTGVYLQWLWIPIVLAGFLVGLVLDLGHRRANKS